MVPPLVSSAPVTRFIRPDWFTSRVFNPSVAALARAGVSILDSRILRVRGRRSGEWRSTPVNLMRFQGDTFLVAPRGNTNWVRNLRASGSGELVLGRRSEAFSAHELPDEAKPELLRVYLKRWWFEAGQFFDGVRADSPEGDLVRIAPDHPVFKISM